LQGVLGWPDEPEDCAGPQPGLSFRPMSERESRMVSGTAGAAARESSPSAIVFDVKRFALHDGPGIRTTVFLKGCPLSCAWCHNPESQRSEPEVMFWSDRCVGCGDCVSSCPRDAISLRDGQARTDRDACDGCGACVSACPQGARAIAGEVWTLKRLLEEIEKDVLFYDQSGGGVTLSGGEPLAQVDFAASLLAACRARRIHTAVDTCGHGDWKDLFRFVPATDLFLYDVKHVDEGRHRELTGVSNEGILENLRRLSDEGARLWIRYPVIPGLNDAREDVVALGKIVAGLNSVEAVCVLPFHRGGERKLDRLGRARRAPSVTESPRAAAEEAAGTLKKMLSVPVRVGG